MRDLEFSVPVQIAELKADGDEWLVDGYASTFGNIDLVDDVILPGAFSETLKSGPKVRFLLSHDPRLVLGVPKKLKEDSKGLFGSFKISKTQIGQDTHQLLMDGAIDSFSIGYKAVDWAIVDENIRELRKIELYEVSLVSTPANPKAVVTRVKEYATLAEQMAGVSAELAQLLSDLRDLTEKDRPLNAVKRKELTELLEMFSGLDDVRSGFQSVLTSAQPPLSLVSAKRASYELAERRKRLAHILTVENTAKE